MMFSLVQSSCSVMSKSLQPHGLQHTRLPCSSPTPRTYSKPRPLTQWCHPTISSSVVPFSSLLQSFPASGSFQMSQLFPSGGQSIGVLASTSDLPMNIQDWFPLGLTGWISLQSKGISRVFFKKKKKRVFSNTTVQKHQFFSVLSFLYSRTLTSIHDYRKNHSCEWTDLCWQSNLCFFNILSRWITAFLPRSKLLFILWLQSPSAVLLEPPKNKVSICFHCYPIYLPWVMGPDAMILALWMLSFKPSFSLSSFTFIKRLFAFRFLP